MPAFVPEQRKAAVKTVVPLPVLVRVVPSVAVLPELLAAVRLVRQMEGKNQKFARLDKPHTHSAFDKDPHKGNGNNHTHGLGTQGTTPFLFSGYPIIFIGHCRCDT